MRGRANQRSRAQIAGHRYGQPKANQVNQFGVSNFLALAGQSDLGFSVDIELVDGMAAGLWACPAQRGR